MVYSVPPRVYEGEAPREASAEVVPLVWRCAIKGNRYRIYDAEADSGITDLWTTPEGMQAWMDWVGTTKFWKENSSVRHIKVRYPIVGPMSGAFKFTDEGERRVAEISLGAFSLCLLTAVHELTHLTKNLYREGVTNEQDHGPAFASMELRMVRRYLSAKEALLLEKSFDRHRVKFDINWNA